MPTSRLPRTSSSSTSPRRGRARVLRPWRLLGPVIVALAIFLAACSNSPAPAPGDAQTEGQRPASVTLIDQALSAGKITADEALAYRVQARFFDPALPKRFAGRYEVDSMAIVEAAARIEELPAAQSAIVAPYLLRPIDPKSAFASKGTNDSATTSSSALGSVKGAVFPAAKKSKECQDWVSVSLEPAPFRVWACRSDKRPNGEAILDAGLKDTLTNTLSTMVEPQPAGMGTPLPDTADHRTHRDNDELIDVYLLGPGGLAPKRSDYQAAIPRRAVAQAIPTGPSDGTGSSGYIIIDEGQMHSTDFLVSVIVHEVFHVLQYRYLVEGLAPVVWFVEASATWAELYYGPPDEMSVYKDLFPTFQSSPLGLTADKPYDHPHQAFPWPLYMQQHAGAESIFGAWLALSGATSATSDKTLMSSIGAVLPWDQHFPQFALQLLNHRLAGNPVSPLFDEVDRRFPKSERPDLAGMKRVLKVPSKKGDQIDYTNWHKSELAVDVLAPEGVPPRAYRFDRVVVKTGSVGKTWGVELRPDDALKASGKSAAMDILLKEKGGDFRRVTVDPTAGGTWCDISEMYVVLTTPREGPNVTGAMNVEIDDAPLCDLGAGLTMKATGDFNSGLNVIPRPFYASMNVEGTLQVKTGPAKTRVKGTRGDGDQPKPRPKGFPQHETERYYPDAGSTWVVNGQYDDHVCMRGRMSDCPPFQSVTFRNGTGTIKDLEILEEDGVFTLSGTLPVERILTEHDLPGAPVQTRQGSIAINCVSKGNFLGYGVPSGVPGNFVHAGAGGGLSPLSGKQEPGTATVKLSCKDSWPVMDGRGQATHSWEGEIAIGG